MAEACVPGSNSIRPKSKERKRACFEGLDLDEAPGNTSGAPEPGAGVLLEVELVAALVFEDIDSIPCVAEFVAVPPCVVDDLVEAKSVESDAAVPVAVLPFVDVKSEAAGFVAILSCAVVGLEPARLVAEPPFVDATLDAPLPFEVAGPKPAVATGTSFTPMGQFSSMPPLFTSVPSFVPSLSTVNLAQLAIMTL